MQNDSPATTPTKAPKLVAAELWPASAATRGMRRRPLNMAQIAGLSPEGIECVERISLGVFADMTNAGHTFAEALSAIYFSGMMHALDMQKDRADA